MNRTTIFFSPIKGKGGQKRYLLLPSTIWLFGIVISISFLFAINAFVDLSQYTFNRISYAHSLLKNRELKADLKMFQTLSNQTERDVRNLFTFEDRVRLYYGLEAVNTDIREVGIGGPETDALNTTVATLINDRLHNNLENLQIKIEKQIRQADFETESFASMFEEIVSIKKKLRRTPSILPTFGRITSGFGIRIHPIEHQEAYHWGIDIANRIWTPLYATADGIVEFAEYSSGFGNLVILKHGFGYSTFYGHLQSFTVNPGAFVARGDLVGFLGTSGRTTGPHVHYEIRRNNKPIDPLESIYPVAMF
ncbi:MAG: hypothetical protein A2519_18105 [Candidatus Raymondbacteria bacterium RIFOXYD12_FULL_49_13]|uniref:M23ase beta-sheet core domain-containing protein n=1 Tax=Candidatus Raymondbacteria bacterium RIFOXYD12_FULL_49_13 TaxID=1817890 RepID=A0A1F7FC62_UNCRA|nr:MAG: hypothetical protein A2519_18105 [Candidatus Raymondbacteria bacterium RIFOXYD12_FULL_49_13]